MKTIYWCDEIPSHVTPALKPHMLLPALSVMRPRKLFGGALARCPAWRSRAKNTFAVISPITFTFETFGDGSWRFSSPELLDEIATRMVKQDGAGTFELLFSESMFCETSLVLAQEPPMLVGRSFHKQVDFISAEFDISKWFRPFGMAFQTLDDAPTIFTVQRGDPLYFIRFNTSEEVVIKKFKMTPRLYEIANMFSAVRERSASSKGPRPLSFFYDLFSERKSRIEVLAEIKANLIP